MNVELEKKLYDEFPTLYPSRVNPFNAEKCYNPFEGFGFECGDGWFNTIYDLSKKIVSLEEGNNVKVTQVKEKFGGLRFYINSLPSEIFDSVHDIICKYEEKSYTVCEQCGAEGKTRGGCWITTLCDECWERRNDV